jgi:serine/threonine protein kinase/tetratricopeptide (TPR) repeat protein
MNGQGQAPGNNDAGQSAPLREAPSPAKAVEPSPINPPTVSDYELIRRIGHGAYGDVWLARSNATGALRAAKIVWRHTFENERPFKREFEGIQRFERISREHPSQLALFHIGRNEPAGYFYYVMELADQAEQRGEDGEWRMENGGKSEPSASHPQSSNFDPLLYTPHTLRADLEKGRLPAAKVLEVGLALSEALSHLHSNGLVHRDVKPSNVIFVNGRPKLADIGLVTDASDQCSIVGTEGYLPPEGPGTPQADIFALGKVLYEASTGLDRRDFPKLPEDLREWPDYRDIVELNEIVLRACAKGPAGRYPTCQAMHADLELLQRGKSVKQKRTRQQRLAVAKKVLATASVLGVLVVAATMLWRQSRVTRPLSENPEALGLYQQALYELKGDTFERRQKAYTNLVEAVRLDPKFVDAYYQMFEVYFDAFGDKLPPHYNQLANWRTVAEKLRQVNPNSVQYHTVNSLVKFWDWKFDDAIEESMLAIKLDPKFLRAHGVYADEVLLAHGDVDTALREFRIAERIDHSDVIIQTLLGDPFNMQRKFDQAIEQCSKAVQLEPQATVTHANLGDAYESAKQYDKAMDEYEQFDLLNGRDPEQTKAWYEKMRSALHEKGPRGRWQAQLDEAKKDPHADPYWMAQLCARLGDTNEVFLLLDRAFREHSASMQYLLLNDCWDPFRDDPRFQELVEKIGFHPIPGAFR